MNKFPSLFERPKKKKQKIKVQPEVDTSDIYYIKTAVMTQHIIPQNLFKVRVRQINNDQPEFPVYRTSLIVSRDDGKYVEDCFVVRKTGENEFTFEPPLGEVQDRSKKWKR